MSPEFTVLSKSAAAKFLGISSSTLDRLTNGGIGPRRINLSTRRIGYRVSDLENWLKQRASIE